MKDQYGRSITKQNYLQVYHTICEVGRDTGNEISVATLDRHPVILTVSELDLCIVRNRENFCPLLPMYMSDEELDARLAQLDQECPDLN